MKVLLVILNLLLLIHFLHQFLSFQIQNLELNNFGMQIVGQVDINYNHQIVCIIYTMDFPHQFNHKYIMLVANIHSMLSMNQLYNLFHLASILDKLDPKDHSYHKYTLFRFLFVWLLLHLLLLIQNSLLNNFGMLFVNLVNIEINHRPLNIICILDFQCLSNHMYNILLANNHNMLRIHLSCNLLHQASILYTEDSINLTYHKYIQGSAFPQWLLLLYQSLMDSNSNRLLERQVSITNNRHFLYIVYSIDFLDRFNRIWIEQLVSNHYMLNMHQWCNLTHFLHILGIQDSMDLIYRTYILAILFLLLLLPLNLH